MASLWINIQNEHGERLAQFKVDAGQEKYTVRYGETFAQALARLIAEHLPVDEAA